MAGSMLKGCLTVTFCYHLSKAMAFKCSSTLSIFSFTFTNTTNMVPNVLKWHLVVMWPFMSDSGMFQIELPNWATKWLKIWWTLKKFCGPSSDRKDTYRSEKMWSCFFHSMVLQSTILNQQNVHIHYNVSEKCSRNLGMVEIKQGSIIKLL